MAEVTLTPSGSGARSALPVVRATITMPRIGAWHADLQVDTTDAPAGAVTLQAGALTLKGFVNRARVHQAIARVRLVGGAGGLQKVATPKHYTSPILRIPLDDLARAAGETLSATGHAATLNRQLLAWTTLGLPTGAMIQALADHVGVAWRALPDGSLWFGPETWPASTLKDPRFLDEVPEQGTIVVGADTVEILPGTTLAGRRVDYVEHLVSQNEIRTKVWAAA